MFKTELAYLVHFPSSKLMCHFQNPFFNACFSLHLCLLAFSFPSLGESNLSGRDSFVGGLN